MGLREQLLQGSRALPWCSVGLLDGQRAGSSTKEALPPQLDVISEF